MEQLNLEKYADAITDNYYLILTSNSKEKTAVNKMMSNRRNLMLGIPNKGASIGVIGGSFVVHITGTSGGSDKLSTSTIVTQYISRDRLPLPNFVLLVGFCWGNPKKTSVGDILLSKQIISLNSQVANKEGLKYKHKYFSSEIDIQTEVLSTIARQSGYSLKVGDLASLELLLSNTNIRDEIISNYPSILGGEMEAFSLLPSLNSIPWLVIKSVSDFGDNDFHRDEQISASNDVSSLIPLIIPQIIQDNNLVFSMSSPNSKLLLDTLLGGTIKIDKESFSFENMNDYLNDAIGPQFMFKLSQYSSGVEYDEEFPLLMTDFLLETVQNSFRYGKAKSVSVSFNRNNISLYETNNAYDATKLTGTNGGASAWKRLKEIYINSGEVTYSLYGRSQKITLSKVDKNFKRIINDCSAVIIPKTIRAGFISEVLSSNEECEEVYVDVKNIFMTSRQMDIIADVKRLVDEGKLVYISCKNESEVARYQNNLVDCLSAVKVFVG